MSAKLWPTKLSAKFWLAQLWPIALPRCEIFSSNFRVCYNICFCINAFDKKICEFTQPNMFREAQAANVVFRGTFPSERRVDEQKKCLHFWKKWLFLLFLFLRNGRKIGSFQNFELYGSCLICLPGKSDPD